MKPLPQTPATDSTADSPRSWLSALADGDAQAAERACGVWRDDADARQAWHTYHLIGDVMRSEELAAAPARDAAFLAAVRARLADEPVVLAPATVAPRRQVWLVPAAAVAGFMVVAGVLVVTRVGAPTVPAETAALAAASGPVAGSTRMVNDTLRAAEPQFFRQEGLIRDARLDEFMRAHQAARGGAAVSAPGGVVQPVDVIVPASPER